MAESKQYYIGVDVGGTSVKLGLFDEEGDLLGKTSVPTPSLACGEGHAAVIGGIEQLMACVQQPCCSCEVSAWQCLVRCPQAV